MSDYLPLEVVIDIFTRLPIKTLLRCTSVCKSWYSFITSPYFVTSHMNLSIANNGSRLLVRFCTEDGGIENDFNMLHITGFYITPRKRERFFVHSDNQTFNRCAKLDFPFSSRNMFFRIIGTFNGLVCLSDDQRGYMDVIILWNPSLKKIVTLPNSGVIHKSDGPYDYAIGFGFVPATTDYKVMRVVYLELKNGNKRVPPDVEIYELSTGLWRNVNVGDFSAVIRPRAPQAFLNGIVHWIGHKQNTIVDILNICIVSCDMKTEKFDVIMLPNSLQHEWVISLATFEETISLIHHEGKCCYIWVMKEYGIVESWTKLFSIDQGQESLWMPIRFRQNGDILLVRNFANLTSDTGELSSYDPKSKRIKSLGIFGKAYSFYIDTYMESLVLLKSLNGVLGRLKNRGDVVTRKGASILPREDNEVEGNT